MAIPVTLLWVAPDTTFIAPLQSATVSQEMTLNNPTGVVIPNFERTVSLTSQFDNSEVEFTIRGKDIYGNIISEDLKGPGAAETVESVNAYHVILSIDPDDEIKAVSAGIGTGGNSIWVVINPLCIQSQTSLNVTVTGTVQYSIIRTPIDINKYPFPSPANIYTYPITASLTNATTNQTYEMTIPSMGVQMNIEGGEANTGTIAFTVLQQGIK